MAFYTEKELKEIGMDEAQVEAILSVQNAKMAKELKQPLRVVNNVNNDDAIQVHHDVEVKTSAPLVPTSIEQIKTYKNGVVVELPPFADGQPFVARITRPSLPVLIRNGKIPNSLLNQATSLFANGASALNNTGKGSVNLNDLFEVIDAIVDAALLEPTLEEIRSVGMELTDEQLMVIFSYTQKGVKALERFHTE